MGTAKRQKPHRDLASLAAAVMKLSKLLTRERDSLPAAYLRDPELRSAYAAYFLPANLKKIHLALADLLLHPDGLLSRKELRVLDLGSGPGTALLGLLAFFSKRAQRMSLSCIAVDRVPENLRIAEDLFSSHRAAFGLDASLKTLRADIETFNRAEGGPFDLIIFSNVLNELFPSDENRVQRRTGLMKIILDLNLESDGHCVVIEPALRETSRDLLQVRDGLVEQGFMVFSPCLTGANCPACKNPRDWCHEDIPWDPPDVIKDIDRLAGLRKDSLKFSYLVLGKGARSLCDIFGPGSFRVVSEPLITKGKTEFYVCGTGGRKLITRLDKDSAPENVRFSKLSRGAIASFKGLRGEGNRLKVERTTEVIIHRHSDRE